MRDQITNEAVLDEKPLVTFALFTYNQEKYISEAVEGALAQTYSPLEIILSDDCSADHTFEIMQQLIKGYKGPHRIVLNRNPMNLGLGLHDNRVMAMAHGELVIFAAGDDISMPQRAMTLVNAWIKAGKPSGSVHSAVETFSSARTSGLVDHGFSEFSGQSIIECIRAGAKGVLGASHAITLDLFNRFGPLPEGTLFEDRVLAFRSLLAGRIIYCPEALVKYRRHDDTISGGEIYSDAFRWNRWVDGIVVQYRSFLADYKTFMGDDSLDPSVILEIDKGLLRAERSRNLVIGNGFGRAMAAFHYSSDFEMFERLKFILVHILKSAERGETALYRFLYTIRKVWRRAKLSLSQS